MGKTTRKALNFDLDTNALKAFYPGSTYSQAYHDIKKFLEESGFQHRQGSGYVSTEPITLYKVSLLINEMSNKLPWLKQCTTVIDATSVGKVYSMISYLKADEKEDLILDGQHLEEIEIEEEYELEM